MKQLCILFVIIFVSSCSSPSLRERSKKELGHYIWSMTLVAPAISAAMGPFNQEGMEAASMGLPDKDRNALMSISANSFHPAKVYGKIHRRGLETGSKKEMLVLARKLESKTWRKFAENLLKYYGEEGSEEVIKVMLALDEDDYELDMKKATIAERISRNSYNFKTLDILFSKIAGASPGERVLYRQSLFVTTYLAVKELPLEELEVIENIRDDKLYQKYKGIFEKVVSGQYDDFFRKVKFFVEEGQQS